MHVIEDLTDRIKAGEYGPGDRLPSYREMRELYGISGATSAKVYALMAERGLVVGVPGRGVYVKE